MVTSEWQCPKCHVKVSETIAVEVAHRCPSNQRKVTSFVLVRKEQK
jgi:hypothetical protein